MCNGLKVSALCAVMASDEKEISLSAQGNAELLLVDVLMI
jgi:hypothetical protein